MPISFEHLPAFCSMSFAFRINGLHYFFPSTSADRAGHRLSQNQPIETNSHATDPWSEIDQRNQRLLHPLNAKDTYGSNGHARSFHQPKARLSSHTFSLDALQGLARRHRASHSNDDVFTLDSSNSFQNYLDKRFSGHPTNSDLSFMCANAVIISNKSKLIHLFESGDLTVYVTKYGVTINEDGPFWPRDYRILHPTPRLLTRELSPKEFYLTVSNSSSTATTSSR